MAREFLYLVQESAYGTPVASPVVGTSSFYTRLDQGNAYTARMTPLMYTIPYGGGQAIDVLTGSDVVAVEGTIQTYLYASQAAFFLNWAAQRINGAQTAPWVTTEPVGDLPSVSIYHAKTMSDGSIKRKQYPGAKVKSLKLSSSRESKLWRLQLGIVAQKVVGNSYDASTDPSAVTFPAPTDAQLPTDAYAYIHSGGGLTLGGVSRTMFSELELSIENVIDVRPFESRFPQIIRWLGRKTTLDAKLYMKPSPDDRATFEAVTAGAASLAISNGTHSATVTLNAQCVIEKIDDDLPLDKVYEQKGTWKNQWDNTAGSDLTLAFT